MGVDFTKRIITGVLLNSSDFDYEKVDEYLTANPQWYDKNYYVFPLNPYETLEGMPDYIIGKIDKELENSGDRASESDRAKLKVVDLNQESAKEVQAFLSELGIEDKEIKTYEIHYFT